MTLLWRRFAINARYFLLQAIWLDCKCSNSHFRSIISHSLPSRYENNFRSIRPKAFYKKGVLRNFAKFTGKHLCQSLFFNKVADLEACDFIKKETLAQFSCEFYEILKNTIFYKTTRMAASAVTKNSVWSFRSSRPEVFCTKGVLKISQNSQKNNCARSTF